MSGAQEYKLTDKELKLPPQQQVKDYFKYLGENSPRAKALVKAAAEAGYAPAQYWHFTDILDEAKSSPAEKLKEVLAWLTLSADKGFVVAQLKLAEYWATGSFIFVRDETWKDDPASRANAKKYLKLAKAQGFVSYKELGIYTELEERIRTHSPTPYGYVAWPFLKDFSPEERRQCLAILKIQLLKEASAKRERSPHISLEVHLSEAMEHWFTAKENWSVSEKQGWLAENQSLLASVDQKQTEPPGSTDDAKAASQSHPPKDDADKALGQSKPPQKTLTPWRWLWRSLGLGAALGLAIMVIILAGAVPALTAFMGSQFGVLLAIGGLGLLMGIALMTALELLLLKGLDARTRGWMQGLVVLSAMGFAAGLALLIATLAFGFGGLGTLAVAALVGALGGLLSVLLLSECVKLVKGYSTQTAEIFPSLYTDEHRAYISSISLKSREEARPRVDLSTRQAEEEIQPDERPRADSQ